MRKLKSDLKELKDALSHFRYTNIIVLVMIFLAGFVISASINKPLSAIIHAQWTADEAPGCGAGPCSALEKQQNQQQQNPQNNNQNQNQQQNNNQQPVNDNQAPNNEANQNQNGACYQNCLDRMQGYNGGMGASIETYCTQFCNPALNEPHYTISPTPHNLPPGQRNQQNINVNRNQPEANLTCGCLSGRPCASFAPSRQIGQNQQQQNNLQNNQAVQNQQNQNNDNAQNQQQPQNNNGPVGWIQQLVQKLRYFLGSLK
jgi:hypothetical protein